MKLYETLFTEIELLKIAVKEFRRGLITENELKERLVNISVIVDYLITDND
jgi:hypothetical protein